MFSINEIFEIEEQIERNGYSFYMRAAENAKKEDSKNPLSKGIGHRKEMLAKEKPVKLYIFAGQSNMDFRVTPALLTKEMPKEVKWMQSEKNDILYSGWTGFLNKSVKNETFSKFGFLEGKNGKMLASCEHVVAYRLWDYWKQKDPEQKISILHVSKGGTSLSGGWNPTKNGPMFKALTLRMDEAKKDFKKLGLKYELAGFFWWQGESDSWSDKATPVYEGLFDKLFTHVKESFGTKEAPLVLVRIHKDLNANKKIKKAGKEALALYKKRLDTIRNVLVKIAEKHKGAWIDIDDVPSADGAHFDTKSYIKLYSRMMDAHLKLLDSRDQKKIRRVL